LARKTAKRFLLRTYSDVGFRGKIPYWFLKENQVDFEEKLTINMGQILSIPYILIGIAFIIYGLIKTSKLSDIKQHT